MGSLGTTTSPSVPPSHCSHGVQLPGCRYVDASTVYNPRGGDMPILAPQAVATAKPEPRGEPHRSSSTEGEPHQSPATEGEPHPSPATEGEPHQSPLIEGDYPLLLPPPSEGDYPLLLPSPPEEDYPLLPPPPPGGCCRRLLRANSCPCPAKPRATEPASPRAAEPASPMEASSPSPGEASSSSPRYACTSLPGDACLSSSGALLCPAAAVALPEILGAEPKKREPLATEKGGEVRRPPPPTAVALPEYPAPECPTTATTTTSGVNCTAARTTFAGCANLGAVSMSIDSIVAVSIAK
ncbi:UNVERIFIED_CONTAM: hypothetical protein FKN15_021710 [Acipenser sinensis]